MSSSVSTCPAQLVRDDNDFPIAWIKREGSGRVFYTSLGHNPEIYRTPQILQHYLDGIQFALGDLRADATPSAKLKQQPPAAPAPESSTVVID
jgi:type 1 glutamine amidotransferase